MVIPIQPTIPFFDGNGYDIWSIKMKTLFISEDLWELVDEGYKEDEIPIYAIRDVRMEDAKALFFIHQAIAESIFRRISKVTKSNDAWDALRREYQSTTEVAAQNEDGHQIVVPAQNEDGRQIVDQIQLAEKKLIERRKKERSKKYEKSTSKFQQQRETHLVVSALVTTVTFAAAFTLPGGYKEDDGEAILSKKAAFQAFVVTDAIAMICSLYAVFLHFIMTMPEGEKFLEQQFQLQLHLDLASCYTIAGMEAMLIAFTTGLYVVLPHPSALSISICILSSYFLLFFHVLGGMITMTIWGDLITSLKTICRGVSRVPTLLKTIFTGVSRLPTLLKTIYRDPTTLVKVWFDMVKLLYG